MERSERLRVIMHSVERGPRSVEDLVQLTGVSGVSIRRDLLELAERGALRRVRGGAAPVVNRGSGYPFGLRESEHGEVKKALARLAATLVQPGDSVVIDNGTTALHVAHEIATLGVTAMALSLHAAAAIAAKPGNQVIVPGGAVDHDDLAFTSAGAAEAVGSMRFDTAFIGACAADPDTGLTVAGWGDAQVKRAVLRAARKVVLVATTDKFERTAAHSFGAITDLDTIVTTVDAPAALVYDARAAGVRVLMADPEPLTPKL